MKRIAITLAFAALTAGASATTASSSICLCDDGSGAVVRVAAAPGAPALHKIVPAKAKPKTRPARP